MIDLSRRPRIELRDRQGQLLSVTYTKNQAQYDRLLRESEAIRGTLSHKSNNRGNRTPLTEKQRASNNHFFNQPSRGVRAAPDVAGADPVGRIDIPLPESAHTN